MCLAFLAEPVLKRFSQGPEQIDPLKRKAVRQAYEEWREAIDRMIRSYRLFTSVVDLILKRVLELDEDDEEDILKPLQFSNPHLVPEHGVTLCQTLPWSMSRITIGHLCSSKFSHDVNG